MRRFRDFIERFAVGDQVGGGVCGGGGSVKKKISIRRSAHESRSEVKGGESEG